MRMCMGVCFMLCFFLFRTLVIWFQFWFTSQEYVDDFRIRYSFFWWFCRTKIYCDGFDAELVFNECDWFGCVEWGCICDWCIPGGGAVCNQQLCEICIDWNENKQESVCWSFLRRISNAFEHNNKNNTASRALKIIRKILLRTPCTWWLLW